MSNRDIAEQAHETFIRNVVEPRVEAVESAVIQLSKSMVNRIVDFMENTAPPSRIERRARRRQLKAWGFYMSRYDTYYAFGPPRYQDKRYPDKLTRWLFPLTRPAKWRLIGKRPGETQEQRDARFEETKRQWVITCEEAVRVANGTQ